MGLSTVMVMRRGFLLLACQELLVRAQRIHSSHWPSVHFSTVIRSAVVECFSSFTAARVAVSERCGF
jgi:hypothetical protein